MNDFIRSRLKNRIFETTSKFYEAPAAYPISSR